jgi:HEAT repeat protein
MPLLRSSQHPAAAPRQARSLSELLALLGAAPAESERREAALDLAGMPQATAGLAAALARETAPRVQTAIIAALLGIGTPEAAAALAGFLTHDNVALRNGALTALQQMGMIAAPAVAPLLASADHDARLFAVYALHGSAHPQVPVWLADILVRESEVNIGLAAVDALAECGGAGCLPLLRGFAARFPDEAFVAFAVELACRRVTAGGPG